ncbi:Pentatricopeptide repeat-containing protein [Vigna angularis]|uniref:Pentatricopeptide repeat-containing protein n=1 Tax=Phaseolus angularis TaxID=3914 RepID=A0A8T0JNE3_PHAAN|nr:Pentatricopeptide repeat-containing protein [Vigna angularis]
MILSRVVKKAAGKLEKRPAEAPKTSMDMVFTLAEAIRFGYAETLGKWNLLDLPRAIFYGIMEKGKKTVAIECKERDDCVELKDPEILKELYEIKKCLTRTMLFSKKRFRAFLFAAGFIKGDVLLRKRRARILKPAFSVIRDKESKCLFVFIRGTRSIKDTLTDAIGAPVSFNHFVYSDGELKRNNVISGHGHRGMVAAARWIKKHCTPKLLDELCQYPDFQVKILGHSLGGGTAALLTFMLREIKQFSSCTCVTFGPGIAIGSRIPFASNAKAIADHAVSRGTENEKKHREEAEKLLLQKQIDVSELKTERDLALKTSRELRAAIETLKEAEMKETTDKLVSLLSGCTKSFMSVLDMGLQPDSLAFVVILSAYSHAGLLCEGRRSGLILEVYHIIKGMPMEPNGVMLRSFVATCRNHGWVPSLDVDLLSELEHELGVAVIDSNSPILSDQIAEVLNYFGQSADGNDTTQSYNDTTQSCNNANVSMLPVIVGIPCGNLQCLKPFKYVDDTDDYGGVSDGVVVEVPVDFDFVILVGP